MMWLMAKEGDEAAEKVPCRVVEEQVSHQGEHHSDEVHPHHMRLPDEPDGDHHTEDCRNAHEPAEEAIRIRDIAPGAQGNADPDRGDESHQHGAD